MGLASFEVSGSTRVYCRSLTKTHLAFHFKVTNADPSFCGIQNREFLHHQGNTVHSSAGHSVWGGASVRAWCGMSP